MNKKALGALNMAGFIKTQSLLLLERLNELDLDDRADECERLHELAEALHEQLKDELERLPQDEER
jgi:hypothetical protein